jgi:hypothetical protein
MTAAPNNRDALAPRGRAAARAGRRDVLAPRGATVADRPDRSAPPPEPARVHWGLEILRIVFGSLNLLLALVVVIICLGISFVSYKMLDVLHDVSKRDFTEASQRFERYGLRFDAMAQAHCLVEQSQPKILHGITMYLWIVQPPGSDDRVIYRWKHDLNLNKVEPMTNPALLMDIALGYTKAADAASYSFYNPDDQLAQALAVGDFRQIGPEQLARRRKVGGVLPGPVMPPKITPEQARARAHTEPEPAPDDQGAQGGVQGKAGDATDVGGKQQDKGSGEPQNPPPDNDAVPVE